MKGFLAFFAAFIMMASCGTCGVGGYLYYATRPEQLIIGSWQPTDTEYRKSLAKMEFRGDFGCDMHTKEEGKTRRVGGTFSIEDDILVQTLVVNGKSQTERMKFALTKDELILHQKFDGKENKMRFVRASE